jgi:uncharacterized protein
MKILAVSDVHGDKFFMQRMAQKGIQEKVDLVIIAGDLVNFGEMPEGLIGPFKKAGLEVAIIPGNHEGMADINFLVEKYNVKNLHGYSMKFGDIGIFGCGYGDIGPHFLNDEQFFETLKLAHDSLKDCKKKLMVTHTQPDNSILGLHNPNWGSAGIRRAINEFQPNLHICGHIHETHGIEDMVGNTRVINVGKTGRIIEL